MKDPVRSVYQCDATHGSYTRCTESEGHYPATPHKNGSYVWNDKPTAAQKANFQEAISGGTAKVLGFADPKKG